MPAVAPPVELQPLMHSTERIMTRTLGILAGLLASAGLALAQLPQAAPEVLAAQAGVLPSERLTHLPGEASTWWPACLPPCDRGLCFWGGAEALGWVVKPHPLSVPVISTGPLSDAGSQVLLGNETLDSEIQCGSR